MHLIVVTHRTASKAMSTYTLTPGAAYALPVYTDTQAISLEVAGTSSEDGLVGAIDRQTDRLGSLLDNLVTELAFQRNRADALERVLHGDS